ncbi:MAG: Fe-S cluster assembly protein SufD [Prochlorococcaceae cyanobacterium]
MVAAAVAPLAAATNGAPNRAANWLSELAAAPLPDRRQEDWRFTDLASLKALEPQLLSAADPLAGIELPAGVRRLDAAAAQPWLGQALAASGSAQHWPVQLNGGAGAGLIALRVSAASAALELPFEAPAAAPGLAAWRLLLLLEAGASLELLLRLNSRSAQALSLVSEVILEPGARLQLGNLALAQGEACLLQHTAVRQAAGSHLAHTAVAAGWALARQEQRIVQCEGHASTRLRGLQVCRQRQIADTHSWVRFEGPEGELNQLHKAVADDQGRSVFNGAVQVPRAAQRTNAAQLSRSLLLSDRGRIDTKPELEIVADDVKCAHGATVSRLQTDELFYLQSRGIAADQAAQLLQRAFCEEVLRELPPAAAASQFLPQLLGEA